MTSLWASLKTDEVRYAWGTGGCVHFSLIVAPLNKLYKCDQILFSFLYHQLNLFIIVCKTINHISLLNEKKHTTLLYEKNSISVFLVIWDLFLKVPYFATFLQVIMFLWVPQTMPFNIPGGLSVKITLHFNTRPLHYKLMLIIYVFKYIVVNPSLFTLDSVQYWTPDIYKQCHSIMAICFSVNYFEEIL